MAAPAPADQRQLPEGSHQAGGGVSGKVHTVRSVNSTVLAHLKQIYAAHAGSDATWSPEKAAAFLKDVQHDTDAERALELASGKPWDFDSFLRYMTSSITHAVAPVEKEDLSWPLSSYFISSSHNTYLTGNQLSSDSSADAYRNVLLRGCRCIEIDVWDGSDSEGEDDTSSSSSSSSDDENRKAKKAVKKSRREKLTSKLKTTLGKTTNASRRLSRSWPKKAGTTATAPPADEVPTKEMGALSTDTPASPLKRVHSPKEPRVLHGFTLTKEVSFRDVCMAIRKYAFATTDTPLIASLEVHCSPAQQEAMVAIIQETWGDYLLSELGDDIKHLPSPAELAGKILVKVKYAPPEGGSPAPVDGEDVPLPGDNPAAKKAKPSKIIQALSKLGIYTRGVSFKSLTQAEATMPAHIFSLSENTVMEVHEKNAHALFEHNRHFLMRTYPKALRIRSSNLDPAVFWRKGIQIVALNWQNWDEGMMLNEGMFAGTSGFVLKPEAVAVKHYTMDLTIQVLAAQSLPLPPGDDSPRASAPTSRSRCTSSSPRSASPVRLPADGKEKEGEYKAKTKSLKGCDPDFKGQELRFEGIPGVVPSCRSCGSWSGTTRSGGTRWPGGRASGWIG
ncbi:hypothetical protein NEMBOFW57_000517 [Staphylotrichum longicolle]|uniref:Phosphoinositide phospholipase C n=1 Tax=Staphylotrichum longicolle TaxID=669026 RepID=A0AAD4F015_9PEZI|nr:hypothetical protein NEMBOFW57_000517 [Staphylotrichum longicolle]